MSKMELTFGMPVKVNYQNSGQWWPGKVMGLRDDGTFDILFDDGDGESAVPRDRILLPDQEEPPPPEAPGTLAENAENAENAAQNAGEVEDGKPYAGSAPEYAVGAAVEVKSFKAKAWVAGKVSAFDPELGTFDVTLDEGGGCEKGVPLAMLRKPGAKDTKSKDSRRKKRAKRAMNEIQAILSTFNEKQMQAALMAIQALDRMR